MKARRALVTVPKSDPINLLRLALGDQSLTVAASEFFDAAGSVDELLFASEKRMASGAYTDLDIATG